MIMRKIGLVALLVFGGASALAMFGLAEMVLLMQNNQVDDFFAYIAPFAIVAGVVALVRSGRHQPPGN